MGLLQIHFIALQTGHLKNTDSLSYVDLNDDTFHYTTSKKNYHHLSHQKSLFKYWDVIKIIVVDTGFPKF